MNVITNQQINDRLPLAIGVDLNFMLNEFFAHGLLIISTPCLLISIPGGSMGGNHQSHSFEGLTPGYKHALWAVIAINGIMFIIEMLAGFSSGSQALKADALDFAGDTATYAISLAVLGASLKLRAKASLFKGASLAVLATFILITTAQRVFGGEPPGAQTMSLIGFMALIANVVSVLILLRWRNGDSNVRSVWLCSRNDAIGNVGVIIAGFVVGVTGSAWPDLLVAGLLATLFLRSSISIIRQALGELRHVAEKDCDSDKPVSVAPSLGADPAPDDKLEKSAPGAEDKPKP